MYTAFYVLFALTVAAFGIGNLLVLGRDFLASRLKGTEADSAGIFDKQGQRRELRRLLLYNFAFFLLFVVSRRAHALAVTV